MAEQDILDIQVTETDINNTITETDLFNYTVPANTLGTNKAIRTQIRGDYLNNPAVSGTNNIRLRVYYGPTEMYEDLGPTIVQDAARRAFYMDFILWPRNATNSQGLGGTIYLGQEGAATTGIGNIADDEISINTPFLGVNAAVDSTSGQALRVTVVLASGDPNISLRKTYSIVESLPP